MAKMNKGLLGTPTQKRKGKQKPNQKNGTDPAKNTQSVFITKTANQWIEQVKDLPPPKQLFSELWHEDELCILFSDTNLGKTILAVQIGDSIARGKPIKGFDMQAEKTKVLYFDLELSTKQFESRYKGLEGHYNFSENFQRTEINTDYIPQGDSPDQSEKINKDMEAEIENSGAKVVIVDNITWLRSNNETAKDALPLMKALKTLKHKHNLSILALAHTPKRNESLELSKNDLAGSRMLMNFCDSSFAIGQSNLDEGKRYLKQIKERSTYKIYGFDNIILCEVVKENNFLGFKYEKLDSEGLHLKKASEEDTEERSNRIKEMYDQGKNPTEMAKELNVSRVTIYNYLKKNDLTKKV